MATAVKAEIVEESVDEVTGEVVIPVRESSLVQSNTGVQVSKDYKPTTLLDYAALMLAARAHPRDMNLAIKQAEAIVTQNEITAKECFYALPRGGKKITGESIGMAETLAACFGNMSITTDDITIDRDEGVVIVRGFILDCETGLTYSSIIRRNIRYSDDHKKFPGQIYNEDMISQTAGAAGSILFRNLVLRVIPRPIRKSIYHKALGVAMGDAKSFGQRQQKCVQHWEEEMGVPKAKLLLHLDHTEVKDLNIQDFEYLLGIENAISTGDTTIDEIFKKDFVAPPPGKKPENLGEVAADLKAKQDAEVAMRAEIDAKNAEAAQAEDPGHPGGPEPHAADGPESPETAPEAPQAPAEAESPPDPGPEAPTADPTPPEAPQAPPSDPEPPKPAAQAPGAPIPKPVKKAGPAKK